MQNIYLVNSSSIIDSTPKQVQTLSNDPIVQRYLDAYLSAVKYGQAQWLDQALEQVNLLRNQGELFIQGIELSSHDQLAVAIYLEAGKFDEAMQILSESRGLTLSNDLLFHFYAEDLSGNEIALHTGLAGWSLDENISQAASKMEQRDWNGAIEILENGLSTADFCGTDIYQHLLTGCYARNGDFDKASQMIDQMQIGDNQKRIERDLVSAMANQSTKPSLLGLMDNWARAQLN